MAVRLIPETVLQLQVTGYLALLDGKRLEVLEDEKEEDEMYMATFGNHNSQFGKGAYGKTEDKEVLALSLLLNGCR